MRKAKIYLFGAGVYTSVYNLSDLEALGLTQLMLAVKAF
jgi:hypothetical protein